MENNGIVQENSIKNNHQFNVQRLFNLTYKKMLDLAKALSQCPEEQVCKEVIKELAVSTYGMVAPRFSEQGLAILADLFSKFPDDSDCKTALKQVAEDLIQGIKIRDRGQWMIMFNDHEFAKLVIAFRKCPDVSGCEAGAMSIAKFLNSTILLLNLDEAGVTTLSKPRLSFNEEEVAKLIDVFSKFPDNTDCKSAGQNIGSVLKDSIEVRAIIADPLRHGGSDLWD